MFEHSPQTAGKLIPGFAEAGVLRDEEIIEHADVPRVHGRKQIIGEAARHRTDENRGEIEVAGIGRFYEQELPAAFHHIHTARADVSDHLSGAAGYIDGSISEWKQIVAGLIFEPAATVNRTGSLTKVAN